MSERALDWERIECEYRAGVLSTREIAGEHEISHTAINKRAKAHGWTRDLSAKIQAKAEALVSRQAVSTEVSKQRLATDMEVVEANATQIARVRSEHRTDIGKSRSLAMRMLVELEEQTDSLDAFEKLGEFLYDPDEKGKDKRNEAYSKAISLSGRVANIKALSETLKNLVGLERQAYGVDQLSEAPEDKRGPTDQVEGAKRLAFILARAGAQLSKGA